MKDDVYLTSALKPVGFKKKFKNSILKPFLIIVIILGILGVLAYYVIVPLYLKYLFRNPKAVFNTVFDTFESDIVDIIIDNNKGYYKLDVDLDVDSDLEILTNLNDKKYSFNFSSDTKQGDMLLLSDNNGIALRKRNKNFYLGVINDNEKVYTYEENKVLEGIYNFFDCDFAKYIGDIFDNLRELNTKDRLSYDDEVIKINGDELKVVRNSLKLNKDDVNKVFNTNLDKDVDVVINAYTTGVTFRGLDVEVNGFRLFYYYENDTKEELYFNIESDNKSNIIKLLGIKKGDTTEFVVNLNGSEIGNLIFNKVNDDSMKLDYDIHIITYDIGGTLTYNKKDVSEEFVIKSKVNDKYVNINIKTKYTYDDLVFDSIDESKVLKYDSESYKKDYNSVLEKENILDIYNMLFPSKEVEEKKEETTK